MTLHVRVGGRYRLGHKIGRGTFGDVHAGTNVSTGQEVAIKLESTWAPHQQLIYESMLYKILAGGVGIANTHWYGVVDDLNVLVMDQLGPSLEDLRSMHGGRFNLRTVLIIADQALESIEYLHSKNLIHRDLKPENFLLGLGSEASRVHLIDFGLAKRYRDPKKLEHIPYREGQQFVGNAAFASLPALLGEEQSRRDDLEAVGNMLVYLARGRLPWSSAATKASPGCEQEAILNKRRSISVDKLCRRLPAEFTTYMEYCRGLAFDDTPDYEYLRRLFREAFIREGCDALAPERQEEEEAAREDAEPRGIVHPGRGLSALLLHDGSAHRRGGGLEVAEEPEACMSRRYSAATQDSILSGGNGDNPVADDTIVDNSVVHSPIGEDSPRVDMSH